MNGNCYTYPLILPEVKIDDLAYENQINPKANSLNCLDYALYDDNLIGDCKQATLHAISEHRKAAFKAFKEELAPPSASVDINYCKFRILKYLDNLCDDDGNDLITLQSALDTTPFYELIVQSIPVNKTCVETEQILWHQRLSHPCDEYLYYTHKFLFG